MLADVALLTAEPTENPAPADPVAIPEAAKPGPPVTLEIARKRESGRPLLPSRSADGTLVLPKAEGEG